MALFARSPKQENMLQETVIENPVIEIPNQEPESIENLIVPETNSTYLIHDPEVVGYSTEEDQYNFYRLATSGLDLNNSTVLDLGCGRGDLAKYLNDHFNNITYLGVDNNPILIEVGKEKYSDTVALIHSNWNDIAQIQQYLPQSNFSFNIFGISVKYEQFEDKMQLLESAIQSALLLSSVTIFILLTEPSEDYNYYSPSEISKLLEGRTLFGIDQTENLSFLRLIVFS